MAAEPVRIDDPADPRIAGFVSIRERDLTGREGLFIAEGTVVLRMLGQAQARGNGFAAEAILLLRDDPDRARAYGAAGHAAARTAYDWNTAGPEFTATLRGFLP